MGLAVKVARESPARERRPARRPGAGAWLLLILLGAATFLLFARGVVTAPFGSSHDGRNAGVWALGSRSLRENGPIQSRLGTWSPEVGVYANHPPLIYLETALAEAIGGSSRAATRAPAWIGSLVAAALLALLLRERGVRGTAVGVAVALTVTTPMFLTYGAMLDTPVTSLPFGVGVLLMWERARHDGPVRPLLAASITAMAVLAGWQSLLVAGVVGLWALARLLRGRGSARLNRSFAAGAVVGVVLLFAWLLWAFGGSLRPLADQLLYRSGQAHMSVSTAELIRVQSSRVLLLFGLAGMLGAIVGANAHPYWNYWFVLPIAIGLAVACADGDSGHRPLHRALPRGLFAAIRRERTRGVLRDAVLERFAGLKWSEVGMAFAAVVVALVAVSAASRPDGPTWEFRQGLPAAAVAAHQVLPPHQQVVWYAGVFGAPGSWLSLQFRLPSAPVRSAELAELARRVPDDLVMVGEGTCVAGRQTTRYFFATAREVAAHPPRYQHCP